MDSPRILFIDIETSPIVGYTWKMYEANVLGVIEPTKILCCAWKWLGDNDVTVRAICDYDDYQRGDVHDHQLSKEIWKVLDEADVVIAHNGDSFDIKTLNARFIANGLTAPSDFKTVDTLKVAKKYFKFTSNSLDALGGYLEEGHKASTGGFSTWTRCMAGDQEAWETMKEYNKRDIELLERIYLRLRPFMNNHPNLNTISPLKIKDNEYACSVCQSVNTIKRGFSVTKQGRYQRFSCQDCGSWTSGNYERVKADSGNK